MYSYLYASKLRVHNLVQKKLDRLIREDDRLTMNTNWSAGWPETAEATRQSIAIEKELRFTSAALLKIKFDLINQAYAEWHFS